MNLGPAASFPKGTFRNWSSGGIIPPIPTFGCESVGEEYLPELPEPAVERPEGVTLGTSLPTCSETLNASDLRVSLWGRRSGDVALGLLRNRKCERPEGVALGGRSESVFEHPNVKNKSDFGLSLW
ncbi:hypothetical protein F2Q69_00043714 [Brassica cretica]|uniref:Uncharacterized protein n=1 Tax=Brassica cretica TaxID=69181 RepID=A0A8S9NEJ8_BRACR|nr:hypothetical protein F2Q69_00043714 [Brassica cretica]